MFPSNNYWRKMTKAVAMFLHQSHLPGLVYRLMPSDKMGKYQVTLVINPSDSDAWAEFLRGQGFIFSIDSCHTLPGIRLVRVDNVKL